MALFLIAYGFGLGTIPWIIIAEIYPIDVRAVAVGQCIVMTWLSNFVVRSAPFRSPHPPIHDPP